MSSSQDIAFKEWAVVCEALASGRQSLILRKGGIHEGRDGFRVEHREFWLFPTAFHQADDVISTDALPLLEQVKQNEPSSDEVRIRQHVTVESVYELCDEEVLSSLQPWHIWSEKTIRDRFHYRTPGLYALTVRISQLPEPIVLPNLPRFAGCRSWVDLSSAISAAGLLPVLDDATHLARMRDLDEVLRGKQL